MQSLVTGGAGFIGSHIASKCIEVGHEVVVLDDLSGGFLDNIPSGAKFINGSINDHDLINNLFQQYSFDYVFHLAAYAAEGLSHFIRRFNYMNNLIGSVNLINASVNVGTVKRFVFTSSIAVYGSGQTPMIETMAPMPEDPYGIAKLAVERDLMAAHELFGLDYTIFRPHNVYGERQNTGDRYRNVIGIFMNQIMNDKPMTVFGDGQQTRAFSHVDDVAPLIVECVNNPNTANEIFNVGADTPYTVLKLAKIVALAFGEKNPNILHLDARNEVVHAYSSHDKARQTFGQRSTVDLADGIARMVEWTRKTGIRRSQIFKDIEVEKNMPVSWQQELNNCP